MSYELRESFLFELRSHSGFDIAEVYRHLFTCMEYNSLELLLKNLKSEMDDEHWFYSFHKSMRQTDFYDGVNVTYIVDKLTDEDRNRIEVLRKVLPMYPVSNAVKTEQAISMGLANEMEEFRALHRKSKVEEKRSIAGNLDMVLWNLIHADKDNFLKKFIENFFKQK
jgi:hypothetical protein